MQVKKQDNVTHAVSISFVNSSTSSGCACNQTPLKSRFRTGYCGLVCHALKKAIEESASHRYLDAVKWKLEASMISQGAIDKLDIGNCT